MIGVDKIGDIRRAYFEQQRPIKEIVRTLSVSRATVRKVIRSHKTEHKYERGVQPLCMIGIVGISTRDTREHVLEGLSRLQISVGQSLLCQTA